MNYRSPALCVPFSAGGKGACLRPPLLQRGSLGQEKKKPNKRRETENATHYIKGAHCHGDQ